MSNSFGMPGIGGSLGQCALCGETFLKEILLGKNISPFNISGCNQTLHAHKQCLENHDGKNFKDLPEKSPLRIAFEKNEHSTAN